MISDEFGGGDSIGVLLGVHLALFEHEWQERQDDHKHAQMVTMISETYRNFAQGGLDGFKEDFARGYELGKRDVRAADPFPHLGGPDDPAL